jgi:hypothetical protein
MTEQAAVEIQMESHPEGGSEEDKIRLAFIDRDADKLAQQVSRWTTMVNRMELSETAMTRTAPIGMASASATLVVHGDETLDDKSVVLNSLMPRYHRKVPDHEMPKIDRKYSGPVRTNVRLFLHEFKTQGNLSYGSKVFAVVCYRLLALANLDQKVRDKWDELREKAKGDRWSWDKCEQVFVECALSIHEKQTEVEDFARQGREKGEAYAEFAARLRRLVEVYRVRELAKQADVVTALKMSIPSLAMTVMQQGLIIKMLLAHVGMDMPDTNSVDFLMDAIPTALGPDDCTEWKTFIEGSKKARALRDAEEAKTNPGKQQQQQQQKKPMGAQVNGGAVTNKATIPSAAPAQQNHQGQFNGHGGGRGRGRGRFQPYRGEYSDPDPDTDPAVMPISEEKEHQDCIINFGAASVNSLQETTEVSPDPKLAKVSMPKELHNELLFADVVNKNKVEAIERVLGSESDSGLDVEKKKKEKKKRKKKKKKIVLSSFAMAVHLGSSPLHPLDGGEGRVDADVAPLKEKIKYGAVGVVKEGDVDCAFGACEIEDDRDNLDFEKYSMENNPMLTLYNGYPLFEFGDDDFSLVQKTYGSARRKNQPDNRLFVPVRIFGDQHLALIDTGATHSFISVRIVSQYAIPVNKMSGCIELADSSIIQRVGETENVEVVCGSNLLCAPYEVIDQQHAITIGMDLFHRYGFNIIGLPDPVESPDRLPVPVEDEKPTLIPLAIPEIERTWEFRKEKRSFSEDLRGLLEANGKIPATSFCPVPEMEVRLPVPDNITLNRRSRVFAHSQRPVLDDAVARWLEDDVITLAPAGNRHNNTLTLAAKKDANGEKTLYRVCLDPRPLNAYLPDDNFPVPLISDIMQFAGGKAVFSTVDLKQAYHRLPIHEDDRPLTAFTHGGVQYMFKKAPFGLKPLSSLFQRGMSRILGDLEFVRNFIDDILIASKDRKDHFLHVKEVVERLTKAKLIINTEKCSFYSTQVSLLGFIINTEGKRVDPNKLVNINDWQPPTTGKQVQSYMGTFNFFREYMPLISTVAAPLDALRNVAGPFVLNKLQLRCFNALKNILARAPILSFPDFSLPFYVATDASNVGIGAVCYQLPGGEDDPKNIRYISFVARSLQERERRYSTTQKELLGIVFALKKLHFYLWGNHFTLFTDHRALTYMHTQKDMNSMLTGWQEIIWSYTFKVVFRPGVQNVLPDALSRQFPQELWTSRTEGTAPSKVYGYIHLIQDSDTPRQTVPLSERNMVLADAHALGHFGTNAMVKHIHGLSKTWPHLANDCLKYVQRCRECQRVNIARKGYHPMTAVHAQLPGEHMAIDLAGPFPVQSDGNEYLLILVDVCTRFVILEPIPNKATLTVAKVLFRLFTTIGFPRVLQSDNGREFVSDVMKEMTTSMNVQHRLVTPYHPRGNGVAENHVKTACTIIRKEVEDNKETWARHAPMAQLAMNARVVALHNSSPFALFFARRFNGLSNFSDEKGNITSHEELMERLEYMTKIVFPAVEIKARETQRRMIERFNRTVLHNEFPDGAKVMSLDPIKGDKLSPRYEGPYTVVQRTTGGSYVLRDGTGELLQRNFAPSQLKLVLDDYDDTVAYEVEKIVDHRDLPGEGIEYRVKWKGFKELTWEPQKNFIERKCISDYWKTRDRPIANSLPQPRQTSKTHEPRKKDNSPMQRKGKRQSTDKPMNDTTSDVTRGRKRKRGEASDKNEGEDRVTNRRSKRQLRNTVEESSEKISTTRTRKQIRM